MIFRKLTEGETKEFKQWARENYKPFTEIKGIWHPIVQEECVQINKEKSKEVQ